MKLFSTGNLGTCSLTQPFGANDNPYYADHGMRGHTGADIACGYGTPIYSDYDGTVYKVLTRDNPSYDGSGYTGVFMIVDDGVELFEWQVGHCDPTVSAGDAVKRGDQIATEANHGAVYVGGTQITPAMQAAGDRRGSHRHVQKRPLERVREVTGPMHLTRSNPVEDYVDQSGFMYQCWDFHNGYQGCVDPYAPTFSRNLAFGMSGYDVYCLQRLFIREGLAQYDATGFFGPKTLMSAVAYQRKYGIGPALGFVGPITRGFISKSIQ